MLRAFAFNPISHTGVPTVFPPAECEICGDYPLANESSLFSSLLSYLESSGVVGTFATAVKFDLPNAWEDVPHLNGIEEIVLTGSEAEAALTRLYGYELNEWAFLDHWRRFLYGGAAGCFNNSAQESMVRQIGRSHLDHLRRVLTEGSRTEWLLVYDMEDRKAEMDVA
ncbi:MAG: hypothetical protein R3B84_01260 [Zavarzinella sp.]